jgi:hypothetical protein
MPDYRDLNWDIFVLTSYGKELGKKYYWKIYVSENIIRVIIHSVLKVQVGPNWWNHVVDPKIQGTAARIRNNYLLQIPPKNPGRHDVYCTYLPDLGKILFANKGYFYPLVPDVDKIIIGLERIRLSRNLVGHMNVLTSEEKRSITNFYKLSNYMAKKLGILPNFQLQYP